MQSRPQLGRSVSVRGPGCAGRKKKGALWPDGTRHTVWTLWGMNRSLTWMGCYTGPTSASGAPQPPGWRLGGMGGGWGGAVGVQEAPNSSTKAKSFQSRISAFSLASAVCRPAGRLDGG